MKVRKLIDIINIRDYSIRDVIINGLKNNCYEIDVNENFNINCTSNTEIKVFSVEEVI